MAIARRKFLFCSVAACAVWATVPAVQTYYRYTVQIEIVGTDINIEGWQFKLVQNPMPLEEPK